MTLGRPLAGAGQPQRGEGKRSPARRVGSWLVWWVLLMAFWVWIDDSLMLAELVAGAVVAAAAATLTEIVQYQSSSHVRIRIEWLARALRLPWQILTDTGVVLQALWRVLVSGDEPPSGFEAIPVRYGDDSDEGATRRALILGGSSVSPNTFALGFDERNDVLIVHRLVRGRRDGGAR